MLKLILESVPDLAWLRELTLDKKVAVEAVSLLAEDNYHNREASAAQICLWMLTGYNQNTIHRLSEDLTKQVDEFDTAA